MTDCLVAGMVTSFFDPGLPGGRPWQVASVMWITGSCMHMCMIPFIDVYMHAYCLSRIRSSTKRELYVCANKSVSNHRTACVSRCRGRQTRRISMRCWGI